MGTIVAIKIVTAVATALLFTIAGAVPIFLLRTIEQEYFWRREARRRVEKMSEALHLLQPKLQLATDYGSKYFRSMSKKSDLALYSVQKEMLQLAQERDELQLILAQGGKVRASETKEYLRLYGGTRKARVICRQKQQMPQTQSGDADNSYAVLEQLINHALICISSDAQGEVAQPMQ